MAGIILLSLLAVGAFIGLITELNDDDPISVPATPGDGDTDDELNGDDADNLLNGGGGDDLINGLLGGDLLSGDAGDDTVNGDEGDDVVSGGEGNDALNGGAGQDLVYGGDGDDALLGGDDDDIIVGGKGADTMGGEGGDDALFGVETQLGNQSAGIFAAEDAPDVAQLLDNPDTDEDAGDDMSGGEGNDTLFIGGDDTATGDAGEDTFQLGSWIRADHAATITDYTPGEDVISYAYDGTEGLPEISVADDGEDAVVSADGVEISRVLGAAGTLTADDVALLDIQDEVEPGSRIIGTDGDDSLTGTDEGGEKIVGRAGDDTLAGLDGKDALYGWTGADLLDGGVGHDTLEGGTNNDTLLGGRNADVMRGGDGADVMVGGKGMDSMTGNSGDDIMDGHTDEDDINGAAGNDAMQGGWGLDEMLGGSGNDLMFGGQQADTVMGEAGDDTIVGVDVLNRTPDVNDLAAIMAAEVPEGLALDFEDDSSDADVLDGGEGNDLIQYGNGDTVTGGAGEDDFQMFADVMEAGQPAEITDFSATDDMITVFYANGTAAPAVSYADDGAGNAQVLVDGEVVTTVTGADAATIGASVQLIELTA